VETLSSGLDAEQPGALPLRGHLGTSGVANIDLGQSIRVTDLHIVMWYGALANQGQMHYPNIVREVRTADGSLLRRRGPEYAGQLVSAQTARVVSRRVAEAIEHGTGMGARVSDGRVGGRTGTAQTRDREQRKRSDDQYLASSVGIAPVESPRFVVLVRVAGPRSVGRGPGTPVLTAKRVLEGALRLSVADLAPSEGTGEAHGALPPSRRQAS
jgi:cell division protein FtsI/penicillin-binding protein 2